MSLREPGPTARTLPRCGFSLAVSGNTMPLVRRLLLLEGFDDQAVTQRLQIHGNTPFLVAGGEQAAFAEADASGRLSRLT